MGERINDIQLLNRLNHYADALFETIRFLRENEDNEEYKQAADICNKALDEVSQGIYEVCASLKG
jgi:hypothetical protein